MGTMATKIIYNIWKLSVGTERYTKVHKTTVTAMWAMCIL